MKHNAENKEIGFFERAVKSFSKSALVNLIKNWKNAALPLKKKEGWNVDADLSAEHEQFVIQQMRDCLDPAGGEVTARKNTAKLGGHYLTLSEIGRRRFLNLFNKEFSINLSEISKVIGSSTRGNFDHELERKVLYLVRSPRVKVLRQFLSFEGGLKFIMDMRGEVLSFLKDDPSLACLEADLYELLSNWFDVGLLDLQQITWNSPASLLEKLIVYEAVHQINSWEDLRNRLDSDRRCFAFFHHKVPTEPLIFVEVALTNELSRNIHMLLDEEQPVDLDANTAIFYSISSTQPGLAKISLGNFLIKRVVSHIAIELPQVKIFGTLSPIPSFVRWVESLIKANASALEEYHIKLSPAKIEMIKSVMQYKIAKDYEAVTSEQRELLTHLCAYYLLFIKKNSDAMDPVANFHLSNGAMVKRLNWGANLSVKGIKESFGMMVNYLYELEQIENRHEQYMSSGKVNHDSSIGVMAKTFERST